MSIGTALPGAPPPAQAHATDLAALKTRWTLEIERYERKAEQFVARGKKIVDRYVDERKDEDAQVIRYNVLWSNLQTLRPALYAKDPSPEVERRFKDEDAVGRTASDVLERCLSYLVHKQGFGDTMRSVVLDRLLPGRGVAWARYVPHMRDANVPGPQDVQDDGTQLTDDTTTAEGAEAPLQEVYWEEVKFDFVNWQDFGHTIGRTWEEIDGVWRICYLSKEEVRVRFGAEIAAAIPFDQEPEGLDKDRDGVSALRKSKIYEIWDKLTKRAMWLHRSHPSMLDVRDDPLRLEGFYPCPRPLQATVASSNFIPTADYQLWKDQAAELDQLTQRIKMLTRAIKAAGVYDSSVPGLRNLLGRGNDNTLIPVDQWAAFAEKDGLKGAIELLEVKQLADVLMSLYEARDHVKADLYEISGLSDLLRGASDPETTASAEKIKSSFASVRLKDMQRDVQVFARDLIRICGEIVAEHFSLDTIKQICGVRLLHDAEKQQLQGQLQMAQAYQQRAQQLQQQAQGQAQQGAPMPPAAAVLGPQPPVPDPKAVELLKEPSWEQVDALLRDNAARSFRIDIETDSTIAQDERQEQEARVGFAETMGKLLQSGAEVAQSMPELAPAISETFMFVLRSFKVGRPTESAFQVAMDKLAEKAKQPSKPDPESIKAQSAMQTVQAKAQADAQISQMTAQSNERLAQVKAQADVAVAQAKAQADITVANAQQAAQQAQYEAQARVDVESERLKAQIDDERHSREQQFQQWQAQLTDSFNRWKTQFDNETKMAIAQLQAQTQASAAQAKSESDQAIAQGNNEAKAEQAEAAAQQPQADAGGDLKAVMAQVNEGLSALLDGHTRLHQAVAEMQEDASQPTVVLRDENGRAIGVQRGKKTRSVKRGTDGKISGVQ